MRCTVIGREGAATTLQNFCDEGGGDGFIGFCHFFWCALGDYFSAFGAGFGANVDDMICFGGEVHVVFDDDDGVAFVDEAMEDIDESGDVLLMESDGRFLDEIEIGVCRAHVGDLWSAFDELSDEFETLGFSSRKGGAGLAK